MSGAEVRQAIADAANTVTGMNVSPYYKQSTRPGDGYVRKFRVEYPNPFGGLVTWQILIAAAQDIPTAERFMDDQVPALVEAISGELVVTDVTAVQFQYDSGLVPGIQIQGRREE